MKYKKLNSDIIMIENERKLLNFIYKNFFGRFLLKIITNKWFSKIVGIILNNRISKIYIKKFIKDNNIDIGKYEKENYKSFNDFFKRKLKKINMNSKDTEYISTAEAKLSCYKVTENLILDIKNSKYSIKDLIQDEKLSEKYNGGMCLIYRLTPSNYHRYIYVDDGILNYTKKIKGKLHTVSPIIYDKYQVFTENSREVSLLTLKNFGEIVQIEVGALCVGKINNNKKNKFKKYEEKGFFEFGGSTIIQLIKKEKIIINKEIIQNTNNNIETFVEIGEVIGNCYNYII